MFLKLFVVFLSCSLRLGRSKVETLRPKRPMVETPSLNMGASSPVSPMHVRRLGAEPPAGAFASSKSMAAAAMDKALQAEAIPS